MDGWMDEWMDGSRFWYFEAVGSCWRTFLDACRTWRMVLGCGVLQMDEWMDGWMDGFRLTLSPVICIRSVLRRFIRINCIWNKSSQFSGQLQELLSPNLHMMPKVNGTWTNLITITHIACQLFHCIRLIWRVWNDLNWAGGGEAIEIDRVKSKQQSAFASAVNIIWLLAATSADDARTKKSSRNFTSKWPKTTLLKIAGVFTKDANRINPLCVSQISAVL